MGGSSMRSRAFEMHDDPDEYSLEEDDLGELDGVEEEELEKVLRTVAEKEIMLKKLTNDMVKQFLTNDDDVNDEESAEEDEATRSRDEEKEREEEEEENETREDGSIAFDSIDDEKRDELLKDIWLPKRASMRGSVKLFLDSADDSEWRKW